MTAPCSGHLVKWNWATPTLQVHAIVLIVTHNYGILTHAFCSPVMLREKADVVIMSVTSPNSDPDSKNLAIAETAFGSPPPAPLKGRAHIRNNSPSTTLDRSESKQLDSRRRRIKQRKAALYPRVGICICPGRESVPLVGQREQTHYMVFNSNFTNLTLESKLPLTSL